MERQAEEGSTAEVVIDEVAGAVRLAGALVDQLTVPVRDTHRAIADRVFRLIGPVATPVRLVHDAIAGAVYASVRGGARLSGAAAGTMLAAAHGGRERRALTAHPRGAQATAFLSGLLGDWMEGRADDLRVRPSLTHHGRPMPLDPADLADELDAPTDRLVLFVHGLAETTAAWRWWPTDAAGTPVPSYAERLEAVGWTPLELGYDTGAAVVANGEALSALLQRLVDGWPSPVSEVALVGHSMGGLVVAAACHHGVQTAPRWTERVSHVVTLGTPHRGSWLAQLAARGSESLARLPETAALGGILELRSAGIRDLTEGWPGGPVPPADDAEPDPMVALSALLPRAQHAFVAATLGRSESHLSARLVGDGLVHLRSSTGPARGGGDNVVLRHHVGVGHLRLLHHPAVADDLVEWLGPRAPSRRRPEAK